jgi:diguanylate cyclase (GGDEF)-like protein/PAS domain S-box-containing protein
MTDNLNTEKIKVLLVEDDEEDYILFRYLIDDLKNSRFQLDWERNGAKALELMKAQSHDIYFVDYRLGADDGLTVLQNAVSAGCKAPIILLTGQGDVEVDLKAMQAGAADYLIKSELEAPLLERAIRYSLQHARSLEKMQASEMKFRSVIQSASDAIFLVNPNGEITLWNKAAEKIFGYTEEEIIGEVVVILMGEKYAKKAKEFGIKRTMQEILAPLSGEVIQAAGRRKDGTEFPLEMSGAIWQTVGEFCYTAIIRDITERQKANEFLKESEERYRDLFENANDIIYVHDLQGNFMSVNQTGLKVFGYEHKEIKKLNIANLVVPEDLEKAKQQIALKIDGKESSGYELSCFRKDGRRVSFEINSRIIYENGQPVRVQGIARDVTKRKLAEEERDRLYTLSNDLLGTFGFNGEIIHINPAWKKILDYENDELLGRSILRIIHPEDEEITIAESKKLKQGKSVLFESRLRCKDGSHRWILWSATPMVSENISYAVGRDITERKQTEEILEYNALYDMLTNLPNRTQFMNHLQKAIDDFNEKSGKPFAVLFLDLDRFKIINDGLGHLIGDKLLVAIAERIKASLRPGDIVARLGGDEFTLLIHNVLQESDAVNVAERIQRQLSKPFKLDNYEVFSSASIGIIISDESKRNPEDFLRDADAAMYRAKESGKARYEIFDHEMYVRNMNLLKVETDLRRAIERKEFKVFYQPIVCLKTGKIAELEALIRWEHPEHGLVLPNEFIEVAEETGLIIAIGELVLEESCRQVRVWQEKYQNLKNLAISVNLSAKQLMHPSLSAQVKEILAKTNLDPKSLKLEVTESTVMENSDTALQVLKELNRIGVEFSTDDFGTGYSSLSYLHQFSFKRIKIDRSFVGKMDNDVKSEAIVRTILMLGENLGIEVVAEGIENLPQFQQLRSLNCKLGQGYLFSKPANFEFIEKLLKNGLERNVFAEHGFVFSEVKDNGVIEIESYQ